MAGRPKLNNRKKYLLDFAIELRYRHSMLDEFLFNNEFKFLEMIEESNFTKMNTQDFKKFIEQNIKLINSCRYIENRKIKYNDTIKYIQNKNPKKLTNEEINILDIINKSPYAIDYEYLYKNLDIYHSAVNEKIKSAQYINIKNVKNIDDPKKVKYRKIQNHQKYFIGGTSLSLHKYLNPAQDKSPDEVLIEMTTIYMTLGILNKTDEFLAEFDKNQHLPIFDEISKKFLDIQNDLRNPFKK